MAPRCIVPATRAVGGRCLAAPSKSWTHRALVAAALADGASRIERPLVADDTLRTRDAIRALGIEVLEREGAWIVEGRGGAIAGGARVDCGASGTTARFVTALAALAGRETRIDGDARLRARPMEELCAALRRLGADVRGPGTLPLEVGGARPRGGEVAIPGERSSQFASALLLVGASLVDGLDLTVLPPRASFSYALLTAEVLARFGIEAEHDGHGRFRVEHGLARAADVVVDGDYSSASYLFAAAAIAGGRVVVQGLGPGSRQPDARFLADLAALGCEVTRSGDEIEVAASGTIRPFDLRYDDAPDLAPTAAALALCAEGESVLRGLRNLRHKESDRLAVLAANAARLGAAVRLEDDLLAIRPPARLADGVEIDVAGDHRIAMAFALVGLGRTPLTLSDAGVVAKSYPGFWEDLGALGLAG